MNLSNALNAESEVVLGNLTLKVRSPTLRNIADFEKWLQAQVLAAAREFAAGLPETGRTPVLQEAMRIATSCSFSSQKGQEMIQTMSGFAKLVSLCAKKADGSSPTIEEILDNTDFNSLITLRQAITGGEETDPTKAAKTASPGPTS